MVAENIGVPRPTASRAETERTCGLSVVLPCLNEAETLATCVTKAQRAMKELGVDGEVVVADNGSSDGSQEIARRLGARVIDVPVKGYGSALSAGITAARSEFVLMADADDSYDLGEIGPFFDALHGGAELVMGNRFLGGIEPGAMPKLNRYLGNPVLTKVGRLLFRSASGDFHCGMRAFRRSSILSLGLRTAGMEFASEMVVRATLARLQIVEVPVTLSPDGRTRPPHLRPWRDGWRHLRFLFLYSPRWLFLYPGIALMVAGTALGIALLPGALHIGSVGLDVNAFVYCAVAVIIGYQAVTFSVFARTFAASQGLLPPNKAMERLFRVVTLEVGLAVGLILFLAGLGLSIYTVAFWSGRSFGALSTSSTIRLVVPAATFMILGLETVLASFFLSILGITRR
ncbi:MAG TPA: glycosyltransferase family 2 protein [Acidimicrobiia bacterium]|nr:glycosyltransferase family 2 protein [Acidimicrobiia bacterium]